MKHVYKTCNCGDPYCNTCQGLLWCEICDGAECQLPTHCPNRPMSEREMEAICNGELDYKDGEWVEL